MTENMNWMDRFLDAMSRTGSVSEACAAAQVGRSTVYRHRRESPPFARAWNEALELATEALEDEARARAFDRSDPGSVRLLMFLLKAHKRTVYGERARPAEPAVDLAELVEQAGRAAARLGYPAAAAEPGGAPVPK
jgi:hypothetical protein